MPASLFDSPLYRGLLGDARAAQLFTDAAEIRAMLIVLGELARAQAALGLIPETSAAAIHRASREVQIDGAGLAQETGRDGVPLPALVKAFREAMQAPEHAAHIHFGATSQDIMDTALMLRLRQLCALLSERAAETARTLADLADTHASLAMAARTWGQSAVPTTFGAVVAGWGWPLIDARAALCDLAFPASLSGAAGTLAAMGPAGAEVRARMAAALGLSDPGRSWHTDRTPIIRAASALVALPRALGKMGEDLMLMTRSGVGEVTIAAPGASSTMPQKRNPVQPALLAALARSAEGQFAVLLGAGPHCDARDGAAWLVERLALPGLCLCTARATAAGLDLARDIRPDPRALASGLSADQGVILAEALTFALTRDLPRPEAAEAVRSLITQAISTSRPLEQLARAAHPDLPATLFDPAAQTGTAPEDARSFAAAARALPSSGP